MNKKIYNMLAFSSLFSGEYSKGIDTEDAIYMFNGEVNDCQISLYLEVIKMISEGYGYEEIYDFIDSYTSEEYENLLEDQKVYVKRKARSDLQKRKTNMEKETI